jgi:hypothetical protein
MRTRTSPKLTSTALYAGPETLEEDPKSFERRVLDSFAGFSDIFLRNRCRSVTKEQLITKFEGFGDIKECEILGHNPPFEARISFTTLGAGAAAIKACDGLEFERHRLGSQTLPQVPRSLQNIRHARVPSGKSALRRAD